MNWKGYFKGLLPPKSSFRVASSGRATICFLRDFSTVLNSFRYSLEAHPSGSNVQSISLRTVTKRSRISPQLSPPYLFFLALLILLASGCQRASNVSSLKVGDKAPPFNLKLLSGDTKDLSVYQGKGLVITFMSSWCPCSKQSIPLFKEAYAVYKDKGVEFLMIGIQDGRGKFERFVEERGIPFPAGYDKGDRIASAYGVHSPPTTVFIGRDGEVKRVFYGNIGRDIGKETFFKWIDEVV